MTCLLSSLLSNGNIEFELNDNRTTVKSVSSTDFHKCNNSKTDFVFFPQIIRGGGVVVGRVDEEGRLSGNKVDFLNVLMDLRERYNACTPSFHNP